MKCVIACFMWWDLLAVAGVFIAGMAAGVALLGRSTHYLDREGVLRPITYSERRKRLSR